MNGQGQDKGHGQTGQGDMDGHGITPEVKAITQITFEKDVRCLMPMHEDIRHPSSSNQDGIEGACLPRHPRKRLITNDEFTITLSSFDSESLGVERLIQNPKDFIQGGDRLDEIGPTDITVDYRELTKNKIVKKGDSENV